MHTDLATNAQFKQDRQICDHNKGTKNQDLNIQDPVYVRDLPSGSTWLKRVVTGKWGPRS